MRKHPLDSPISYYAIFLSVRYLPIRLCHFLGKMVVLMVYVFSRKDRDGLAINLSMALNRSKEHPVVRKTVRKIFINYGQYMVDFFLMPQIPLRKVNRFFTHIIGEERLQKALKRGKGVILLSAHIGNWEFGGVHLRLKNYPLTAVTMAHNTSISNALVNGLRESKGIKIIEVDQTAFSGIEILNCLRNNEIVAMTGDKDFFGRGRITTYFGQKVTFPVGPVALAMNSGAALIPAFVLRQSDGRYYGVLEEPILLEKGNNRDKVLDKNIAKTARIFEKYIRNHPDQWYCPDPITNRINL
jgi:lauroyl/myristoyl acyltransferase